MEKGKSKEIIVFGILYILSGIFNGFLFFILSLFAGIGIIRLKPFARYLAIAISAGCILGPILLPLVFIIFSPITLQTYLQIVNPFTVGSISVFVFHLLAVYFFIHPQVKKKFEGEDYVAEKDKDLAAISRIFLLLSVIFLILSALMLVCFQKMQIMFASFDLTLPTITKVLSLGSNIFIVLFIVIAIGLIIKERLNKKKKITLIINVITFVIIAYIIIPFLISSIYAPITNLYNLSNRIEHSVEQP